MALMGTIWMKFSFRPNTFFKYINRRSRNKQKKRRSNSEKIVSRQDFLEVSAMESNMEKYQRFGSLLIVFMMLAPCVALGISSSVTVKDVLGNAYKDKEVSVEGVIIKIVNYETVLLKDRTGQLQVVMEEDDYLPSKALNQGHPVRIHGTVKTGYVSGIILEFDSAALIPGKKMSDFNISKKADPDVQPTARRSASSESSKSTPKKETKSLLKKIGSALIPETRGESTKSLKVSELLKQGHKGEWVTLSGVIIRQVNYETVLFSDETGQIEVILEEDDHLPEKAVKEGHPIEILGVVRGGYAGSVTIDFDSVRLLPGKKMTMPKSISVPLLSDEEVAKNTEHKSIDGTASPAQKMAVTELKSSNEEQQIKQTPDATASIKTAKNLTSPTVANILSRTCLGKEVFLEGLIVREVNYETVLFSDGTGWIEVVLEEDDHLPSKSMQKGQRIILQGTPRSGYGGKVFIEFDSARVL
jgi:uncharacterized protein YdeI (BOF family)